MPSPTPSPRPDPREPDYTRPEVGQIWQELGQTYAQPHKKVVGFEGHDDGITRVLLQGLTGGRVTKAKATRFNGKSGGYALVKAQP